MPQEIDFLIKGYQIFREHYFSQDHLLYDQLVRYGQNPKVLIIACSDSRVDPAIVTNAQPGDLFVIRNVANLVPPYEEDNAHYHGTSAALEFGVCGLGIRHVVICGHSQCGGIRALLENSYQNTPENSFIQKWMQLAKPAYDFISQKHAKAPLEEQVEICSQQSLIHSLDHLKSFPWVREKIQENKLFLHAWYFDLSEGVIQTFDENRQKFVEL